MKARKIIASALVLSMIASAATVWTASAADSVSIEAEKVTAKAGEAFTLNVSLSDVPTTGIGVCDFALTYDSSIVSVTSVTAGPIADTGSDSASGDVSAEAPTFKTSIATSGVINVSWTTGLSDSQYFITEDGVFLTITGTVSDSAKVGDVSKFSFMAVDRTQTGASGSSANTDLLIGYLDSDWNAVEYTVATTEGSVTVVGDGETTTTTTTISGEGIMYGDVNLDGTITLADLVTFQKYQRGAMELNSQALANANVDLTDSAVNAGDVSVLLKFLIGSTNIPVQ